MNLHRLVCLCLLTLVVLLGCGQSGQLYLPGDPSAVETPPTITSVIEGEEDDDDESDEEDDDDEQ